MTVGVISGSRKISERRCDVGKTLTQAIVAECLLPTMDCTIVRPACNDVALRTESVAVECRADLSAVGEHHGRWSVPGRHHRGVILVKSAMPSRSSYAAPKLRESASSWRA
jgi:hypothetical protein